jgi:uncharacterized membrane protein
MSLGPVQLLVLGFDQPEFTGAIGAELRKLREGGLVRVIDAMVVYKDALGDVTTAQFSDLSTEEAEEFGAVVGALIGIGTGDEDTAVALAAAGVEAGADGHFLDESEMWNVVDDIPNNTAAAIALLEHRWAIPFRDSVREAGGFPISDGWVHPEDLVEVGLLAAEDAAGL